MKVYNPQNHNIHYAEWCLAPICLNYPQRGAAQTMAIASQTLYSMNRKHVIASFNQMENIIMTSIMEGLLNIHLILSTLSFSSMNIYIYLNIGKYMVFGFSKRSRTVFIKLNLIIPISFLSYAFIFTFGNYFKTITLPQRSGLKLSAVFKLCNFCLVLLKFI